MDPKTKAEAKAEIRMLRDANAKDRKWYARTGMPALAFARCAGRADRIARLRALLPTFPE